MKRPGRAEREAEAAAIRNEARVDRRLLPDRREIRIRTGVHHGIGWRLDRYLAAACPRMSRGLFQRWIAAGYVDVEGVRAKAVQRVRPGQSVAVVVPLGPAGVHVDPPVVLHEEAGFLAVAKPAGQLAHQAGQTLVGTLLDRLQVRERLAGRDPGRLRLINRLDRDTSGVVLVGRQDRCVVRLGEDLRAGRFRKTYLALCAGVPEPAHGHWREPLGPGPAASIARVVRADGAASHTEYRVLATAAGAWARLEIRLHTGRQHQIRVHAAHHGHPLLGDWVYGRACRDLPGQALHAVELAFPHPLEDERELAITAPAPAPFEALWDRLAAGTGPVERPLSAEEASRLGLGDRRSRRLPEWLHPAERRAIEAETDR